MTRVPCARCGAEILETTAKANGGLCGPCARGTGPCVVCGRRVKADASGEFLHPICALQRRDAAASASSGISWTEPEQIDWDVVQAGILQATRAAFRRIATTNPGREVRGVVVAYRFGDGVRIEPCVMFSDGEYLDASLGDNLLLNDLLPFDGVFRMIEESLEGDQAGQFGASLRATIPARMQTVFDALERESFGLPLAREYTKTLKDF